MERFILLVINVILLLGCESSEQYSLDKSIPRLQSPVDQIARLRTKWWDGNHIETVFYDHQGRIIERFSFGRSSSKERHFYEGNLQRKSIYYSHSDSSEPGYVSIDTVTREFDLKGRLVVESHFPAGLSESKHVFNEPSYKRYLSYTAQGDTIVKFENIVDSYSPLADINRWERDKNNRLKRHYKLYVMTSDSTHPDTVDHYSQRFVYDKKGRLKMAWFDSMYLGQFYLAPGPDTIWYQYNSKNEVIGERHRYTTDMRNKREMNAATLTSRDSQSVLFHKQSFFSNQYGRGNVTYVVRYKYEKFDPEKHGKLIIP